MKWIAVKVVNKACGLAFASVRNIVEPSKFLLMQQRFTAIKKTPYGDGNHNYAVVRMRPHKGAGWQSGYAADCNSVNAGSIPASASIYSWN